MRGEMPFLLVPVELVLGTTCSYRWCRRCRRTWLALHRTRSRAHRRDTARVPRRERNPEPATRNADIPTTPVQATPLPVPGAAPIRKSGLTGGWVAETGSLTWRLGLVEDPAGEITGGGVLQGSDTSFPLCIRGQSAGDRVTLQVEAAGSRMEFRAKLTSPGSMEARLYLGDKPRPLTLVRVDEQGGIGSTPARRPQAA